MALAFACIVLAFVNLAADNHLRAAVDMLACALCCRK